MRLIKLLKTAKGLYGWLVFIIIVVMFNRFTYSYVPLFTQYIIDTLDVGTSTANLPQFILDIFSQGETIIQIIMIVAVAMVLYQALRFSLLFVEEYAQGRFSENLSKRLRDRLYSHIQSLDYSFHNNADTGDLVQRVTSDIEAMSGFLSSRLPEFFRLMATITFGAIQIYAISQIGRAHV